MWRRSLLQLLGAAALLPQLIAAAAATERVRRIGWIETLWGNTNNWRDVAELLQPAGWTRGSNIQVDLHVPITLAHLPPIAKKIVGGEPDLIVTNGAPATLAILAETRTTPVIFFDIADPVGSGVVSNLSRPGGNATGFTTFEPSLAGKWLQLLRELDPQIRRVAILCNPETVPNRASPFIREFETAAAALAIEPILGFARDISEIEPVVAGLTGPSGGALLVLPDVFTIAQRREIISAADRYLVPTIFGLRFAVVTGGLIAYGPTSEGLHRSIASYIDRILRGDRPGDLPVQAPTVYSLTINLRTARALGLTIPPTILAAADEVIE